MKALDILDQFLSIEKSLQESLAVDEYPENSQSPWGKAYQMYDGDKTQG